MSTSSISLSTPSGSQKRKVVTRHLTLFGKKVKVTIKSREVDEGSVLSQELARTIQDHLEAEGLFKKDIIGNRLYRNWKDDESYKVGDRALASSENIKNVWSILATGKDGSQSDREVWNSSCPQPTKRDNASLTNHTRGQYSSDDDSKSSFGSQSVTSDPMQDLERELNEWRELAFKQESLVENLDGERQRLLEQKTELEELLKSIESELAPAIEEFEGFIQELKDGYHAKCIECQQLEDNYHHILSELQQAEQQLREEHAKAQASTALVTEKESQIKDLEQALRDYEDEGCLLLGELEDRYKEQDQRIEELNKQLEDNALREKQNAALQKQAEDKITELQAKLEQHGQEVSKRSEEYSADLQRLASDLEKLQQEKQQLEATKNDLQQRLSDAQVQNTDLNCRIDTLNAEVTDALAARSQVQTELEQKSNELETAVAQKEQAEERVRVLEEELDHLTQAVAQSLQGIESMNTTLVELREQIRQEGEANEQLQATNLGLETEKTELHQRLAVIQAELEHQHTHFAELEKSLEQTEQERLEVFNLLNEQTTKNDLLLTKQYALKGEIEALQIAAKEKDERLKSLNLEIEEAKREQAALEEEIKRLSTVLGSNDQAIQEKEVEHQAALAQLEAQREESNSKVSELTTEKDELTRQITELENTQENTQEDLAKAKLDIESVQSEKQQLEADQHKLKAQVNELTEARNKLQLELNSTQQRITELEEQQQTNQKELTQTHEQIERLTQGLADAEKRGDEYEVQNSELKSNLESNEQALSILQAKNQSLQAEIEGNKETIQKLAAENQDLTSTIAAKAAELDSVQQELTQRERAFEDCQQQLLSLRNEAEQAKSQWNVLQAEVTVGLAEIKSQYEQSRQDIAEVKDQVVKLEDQHSREIAIHLVKVAAKEKELSGLQGQLETQTNELQRLSEELTTLQASQAALQNERDTFEAQQTVLNSQVEELSTKNSELGNQLRQQTGQINELSATNTAINEQLKVSGDELEAANAKTLEIEAALNQAIQAKEASAQQVREKAQDIKRLHEQFEAQEQKIKEQGDQHAQVQADLEQKIEDVAQKHNEIEELTSTRKQLEDRVLTLNQEKARLKSDLESKTADVERLDIQVSELERSKSEADNKYAEDRQSLEAELKTNTQQLIELKQQKSQIEEQKLAAEEQIQALSAERDTLQSNNEALTNDLAILTSQKVELEAELAQVRLQAEQAKAEKQESELQLHELRNEKEQVDRHLKEKTAELKKQKADAATEKEDHSRVMQEKAQEVAVLQEQQKVLQEKLQETEQKLEEKKTAIEKANQREEGLRQELEILSEEKARLKAEHETAAAALRGANRDLQAALEGLQRDKADTEKKLAASNTQLQQLQDSLDVLTSENESVVFQKDELQREIERTRANTKELQDSIQALEAEKSRIEAQLSESTLEGTRKAQQHQQQLEELQKKHDKSQEQLQTLKDKQDELENAHTELNKEKEALEAKFAALNAETQHLQKNAERLSKEIAQLNTHNDDLRDSLTSSQEQVQELQQHLDVKNLEVKRTQSELVNEQRRTAQLQTEQDSIRKQVQAANQTLQELKHDLEEVKQGYTQFRDTSMGDMAGYQAELSYLQGALRDREAALTAQIESQLATIAQSEQKLVENKRAIAEQEQRIKELEETGQQQQESISQLKDQLRISTADKEKLATELVGSLQKTERLETELQEMHSSLQQKKEELQTAQVEIERKDTQIAELDGRVTHSEQTRQEALAKQKEQELEIADLKQKLQSSEQKNSELQQRSQELHGEIEAVQEKLKACQSDLDTSKRECYGLTGAMQGLEEKLKSNKAQQDRLVASMNQQLLQISQLEQLNKSQAEEINTLQRQLKGLKAQLQEYQKTYNDYALAKRLEQYTNELEEQSDILAGAFETASSQLSKLNDQLQDIGKQFSALIDLSAVQADRNRFEQQFRQEQNRVSDELRQALQVLRAKHSEFKEYGENLNKFAQDPQSGNLPDTPSSSIDMQMPSLDGLRALIDEMQRVQQTSLDTVVEQISQGRIAPWLAVLDDDVGKDHLLEALKKAEYADDRQSLNISLARAMLDDDGVLEKAADAYITDSNPETAKAIMRCFPGHKTVHEALKQREIQEIKQEVGDNYDWLVGRYKSLQTEASTSQASTSANDDGWRQLFWHEIESFTDTIDTLEQSKGVNSTPRSALKPLKDVLTDYNKPWDEDTWKTVVSCARQSDKTSPACAIQQALRTCLDNALQKWEFQIDATAELRPTLTWEDHDIPVDQYAANKKLQEHLGSIFGISADESDIHALHQIVLHQEQAGAKDFIGKHLVQDEVLNSVWCSIYYEKGIQAACAIASAAEMHRLYQRAQEVNNTPCHMSLSKAYDVAKKLKIQALRKNQVDLLLESLQKVLLGEDVYIHEVNGWGKTTAFHFYAALAKKKIDWVAPSIPQGRFDEINYTVVNDWHYPVEVNGEAGFVVVDEAHLAIPGKFTVTQTGTGENLPIIYMTATPLHSEKWAQLMKRESEIESGCYQEALQSTQLEHANEDARDPKKEARQELWNLYAPSAVDMIQTLKNEFPSDEQFKAAFEVVNNRGFPEGGASRIYKPTTWAKTNGYAAVARAAGAIISRLINQSIPKDAKTQQAGTSGKDQSSETVDTTRALTTLKALSDVLEKLKDNKKPDPSIADKGQNHDFYKAMFKALVDTYETLEEQMRTDHENKLSKINKEISDLVASISRKADLAQNSLGPVFDSQRCLEEIKQSVEIVTLPANATLNWNSERLFEKIHKTDGTIQVIYPDLPKIEKFVLEVFATKYSLEASEDSESTNVSVVWQESDGIRGHLGCDPDKATKRIYLYANDNMQGGDFNGYSDASKHPKLSQIILSTGERELNISDMWQIRNRMRNYSQDNKTVVITDKITEQFWEWVATNQQNKADEFFKSVAAKKLEEKQRIGSSADALQVAIANQMVGVLEQMLEQVDSSSVAGCSFSE